MQANHLQYGKKSMDTDNPQVDIFAYILNDKDADLNDLVMVRVRTGHPVIA